MFYSREEIENDLLESGDIKIENENSKISDNVQYVGDNLLNDNLVIL